MEEHILADIGKSVIGAAALGIPAFYFKAPLLLAYLLAGVVLGPHIGFGMIQSPESISTLSEIGLVLLMFILGLEIDIRKLLQAGKAVLVSGVLQFIISVALALMFFSYFGFAKYELGYLAIACSLSSTLIVVKILSDQMDLDALPSRITLGILVLQDLWAIGFLAIQPNLADLNTLTLMVSISKVGLLVLSSWVLAKYILPKLFEMVSKQPELMLILAMAWCFAMCGFADYLNISLEMGALIAGVSIAAFPYHLDVAAKISSLRDFFITLFFVSLGLQIPMPTLNVLWLSGLIIVFVLLSRVIIIFPVLHKLKYGNRVSLLPGVNLSQLSEFSVVLAALGLSLKHIGSDLLSAFIISMVITALISSIAIPNTHKIFKFLNPFLEKIGFVEHFSLLEEYKDIVIKDPKIIILGFHRDASSLLFEFQNRFSETKIDEVLIVDFNPEAHSKLKELGFNCKYGDVSNVDTLRNLQLHKTDLIISTIPDQVLKGITNLKLLKHLKKIAPESKIIVTAEKFSLAKEMYEAGAFYVYLPRVISANFLADIIEKIQVEPEHSFYSEAMTFLNNRKEVVS